MLNQALEQFNIEILWLIPIINWEFTNFDLYLIFISFFITFLFCIDNNGKIYSGFNNLRACVEYIYNWQLNLFMQQVSSLHALQYFPLIMIVSLLILSCNIIGLLPLSFTITSHIILTLTIAIILFTGFIIIGINYNGYKFFKLFIPSGINSFFLLIFVVFIEVLSYIIRPFSLSIRLFANMLAGHTLLFILSGFVVSVAQHTPLLIIIPLSVVLFLFVLELAIAFIQAYVFTVLLLLYLNDLYSVHSH